MAFGSKPTGCVGNSHLPSVIDSMTGLRGGSIEHYPTG